MGRDLQLLKLKIQNDTVLLLYTVTEGPHYLPFTLSKYTTTNLLDKGPVVRSFTVFFVHHTKKSNLVRNKKFCGFQTQCCDYSLVHNFLMAI